MFPASLNHSQYIGSILTAQNQSANPVINTSSNWGRVTDTNPGTREVIVLGYSFYAPGPIRVYGVNYISLHSISAGTDFGLRFALMTADGNFWRGVTSQNTSLPKTYLGGDASSESFATMRTNGGSASGRQFRHNFASPIDVPSGRFWLMCAAEILYNSADTDWSGLTTYGDNPSILSHEEMGTGSPRGLAAATLNTGGINSLDWTSYDNLTTSDVVSAGGTSIAMNKTFSGNAALMPWGLIIEPV